MQEAICPHCGEALARKPKRKTRCPHCDNYIRVREGRLLTQKDADTFDTSHGRTTRNPYQRVKDWGQTLLRRYWPLAVVLALISALFAAVQIYSALTGKPALDLLRNPTPTPTPIPTSTVTPTPTLTPSPTPFTEPAAEGEYLIIVAEFQDNSAARNLDVRTVLTQAINDALPGDLDARSVAAHGIVPVTETEARAIGKDYNAAIILWGRYTDNLIEVNFTPLVALYRPTQTKETRVVAQSIDELGVFVNDLAVGSVRWLSLITIGQVLLQGNRYTEAIAQFDAAQSLLDKMEPDQGQIAATYFFRGNARYDQGDLAGAVADYDRAIELDPKDASAYYNRGHARYAQGDLAGAIEDMDRAIELDPESAAACNNRGLARAEQGDLAGAIEDYDRAIELDSELAVVCSNRGNARAEQGDLAGAIEDYDRAIELDPEDAYACYNRGLVRARQGDLARAVEDFDRAIELDPELAVAYNNRGVTRSALGQHEEAIADFDQALALDPECAAAYNNRGRARSALGQHEEAIADYDQAIALFPDGPDRATAYYNLACAYALQQDLEKALPYLRRALTLQPEEYCRLAAKDPDFDAIRDEPAFQALLAEFCPS